MDDEGENNIDEGLKQETFNNEKEVENLLTPEKESDEEEVSEEAKTKEEEPKPNEEI